MPSKTFASNKSSLFADGSSNLGGGADDHLPVGPWSGYNFVSAVRFALDWSGVKTITKATLRLRTSSQYHLAFSSDPDIYVRRITSDWTANSAQGDGGSWSTSPTVYPGPSATTSGEVLKDITTTENATVDIDITAIVRAWAPSSVVGGGGAPNYGVQLIRASSADVTEFNSYRHGTAPPSIILDYATDTAPVVTMTGPAGLQSTTRPTITGTVADAQGDATQALHVEVLTAGTESVVYQADLGAVGTSFSHVPTADLPGGALEVRAVAQAGGLAGGWSARIGFTIDRPAAVAGFTAPPATTGSRRPPIAFAAYDPDVGDGLELYDLEVYAAAGGAPTGAAVYLATNRTDGISGANVTHTPTVDLPGGNLVARARVRSGPADLWSAWSAYHPFFIALDAPSVQWVYPATDGGWLRASDIANLATSLEMQYVYSLWMVYPPAGQTLTRHVVEWKYHDTGWVVLHDGAAETPAGGSQHAFSIIGTWLSDPRTPYGQGRVKLTSYASGGGVTTVERAWKASLFDWVGSIALGDGVTELAPVLDLHGVADSAAAWVRAQTSATAAAPNASWRPPSSPADLAIVQAELPATNAYLGLRVRFGHRNVDTDRIVNGYPDSLDGWRADSGGSIAMNGSGAGRHMTLTSDGTGQSRLVGDGLRAQQPVIPGAWYIWGASCGVGVGSTGLSMALYLAGADYGHLGAVDLSFGPAGWLDKTVVFQAPAGCHFVMIVASFWAVPQAGALWGIQKMRVIGPKPGEAGANRWDISWKSLG